MRSTSRLPVMIEYLRCFDVGEQPVRDSSLRRFSVRYNQEQWS